MTRERRVRLLWLEPRKFPAGRYAACEGLARVHRGARWKIVALYHFIDECLRKVQTLSSSLGRATVTVAHERVEVIDLAGVKLLD